MSDKKASQTTSSRRLAAIMFTDIVGYTKLMGEDEDQAFQLLKKNRLIQRPIIEKYGGKWLKEIGDGVLASFNTVSDAVYCAGAIQKACEEESELWLRIGIHQGEVVFEGEDVFGDGVNIASRLEPLAPAGGIMVSDSVNRNLQNKKGIITEFVREESLKNVKHPVRIYQVKVDSTEATSPADVQSTPTLKSSLGRSLKGIIAILGFIILTALVYFIYSSQNKDENDKQIAEIESITNSVAVLPFRNDSPDQENEYFCNGMMEEILDKLAKIKDLKVPSRTVMESYRNTSKDPRDIGKELQVANVLEGSVRKQGNSFRINVQLISAEDGYHIWSETYSGTFSDTIFIVQSNIAQNIAQALNAAITPEEVEQINEVPTENIEAYDLYMKGIEMNQLYWKTNNTSYLTQAWNLYQQVYEIDPQYAQAYHGMGVVFFAWRQYDSALVYGNKAVSLKKDFNQAYGLIGETYLQLNQPEEAIENFEKIKNISTSATWHSIKLGQAYNQIDDYKTGMRYLDQGIKKIGISERNSAFTQLAFEYVTMGYFIKGREYVNKALNLELNCFSVAVACWMYNLSGNYIEAIAFADSIRTLNSCETTLNTTIFWSYFLSKQMDQAKKYAEIVLVQDSWTHTLEESSYLYMKLQEGDLNAKDSILHIANRVELIKSKGFFDYMTLARIYSVLNDKQKVIKNLNILSEMGWLYGWINFISEDPLFDNIRDDEEFKTIIKKGKEEGKAIRKIVREMQESGEIDL